MSAPDPDFTHTKASLGAALPPAGFRLLVREGPDRGASLTIDGSTPGRSLVGSSPVCALRLADPLVSRRHVAVEATARGLRLTDLDSTNGTFIGPTRISEVWLDGSETITIGGTRISVERDDAPPPSVRESTGFGKVLGHSLAMRRLYPLLSRLAASNVPIIVEGETGTGKEHLVEAIHAASPRKDGPYVVFDCTAVAPSLVESELFGHEKGSFTGAGAARKGVFERAHKGTLLIDEIGDLPLELQSKLLRAIERGQISKVGGDRPLSVDVRVLAATRRNLDLEVQRGRFRDDLFHRLAVARIELPPLRERRGDLPLLARRFAEELGGAGTSIPDAIVEAWELERFLGNVRELRNRVARYLALGDLAGERRDDGASSSIASHVPDRDPFRDVLSDDLPWADAKQRVLDAFEGRYVRHLLDRHDGNVTRAAAAAGIARRYFHRLKARHAGGDDDGDE